MTHWRALLRGDVPPSLAHDYLRARPLLSGWRLPLLRLTPQALAFVQTTSTPIPWWYVRIGTDAKYRVLFAWAPIATLARIVRWFVA